MQDKLQVYKKPLQWKSIKPDAFKQVAIDDDDFTDLLYDLRTNLKILKDDERQLYNDIDRSVSEVEKAADGKDFLRSFDCSTARFNNEMETLEAEVQQLSSNLKVIYVLADNISSRVSALDTARTQVVESLQRVNDLRDLRTCADGVKTAMKNEEFDEAAHHVHRFFALDTAVFKASDQFDSKDSHLSMKNCYNTLLQAAADLKVIIEAKFDEARKANDFASMERFFKLFPLINEHTSGLKRFGEYMCSKIKQLGDENFKILLAGGTDDKRRNVIYADTLMLIFEGIARLIELYQPLIDNCYGAEKLLFLLEIIQAECDKQTIRVVDSFVQKRQIEYKSKQVDTFLRNGSINDKIDSLELDILLSEITLMHTRAELYGRFLKRRLVEMPKTNNANTLLNTASILGNYSIAHHQTLSEQNLGLETVSDSLSVLPEVEFFEDYSEETAKQRQEMLQKLVDERNVKLDVLLNRSGLNKKMQEILGKYVLMEQYYMIESVKKAIEIDDVEEGSLTSTLLDDVFFIVRKSTRRSISSSSVDCVCAMLNNGVTLLETEFIKHIKLPIRAGYPTSGWTSDAYQTAQSAYNVIQQKTNVSGVNVEVSATEKQKSAFLVALNNLRVSIECIKTLRAGLKEDLARHLTQILPQEIKKLDNSIAQLEDLCEKIEYFVNLGVSKLCEAAFRSKLKTNAETYLDVSHMLTEEQLLEFEMTDPFIEGFIAQLDKQIVIFEGVLVPENYQALILEVCIEALHQIERCVSKCSFNRLGGLQLDKEYRQLTSYLTSIAGWAVREKCFKLSQIVALLNSECFDEAVEFIQQQIGFEAVLTLNETKKILGLRSDFSRDKVKNLKF